MFNKTKEKLELSTSISLLLCEMGLDLCEVLKKKDEKIKALETIVEAFAKYIVKQDKKGRK